MIATRTQRIAMGTACLLIMSLTPAVLADASGLQSDDFNSCTVKTLWTVNDPKNDATVSTGGVGTDDAYLQISLPAGSSHDLAPTGNTEVEALQATSNTDLEIETKLLSSFDTPYEMYGIIVRQDATTLLRFELVKGSNETFVSATTLAGGIITERRHEPVLEVSPFWLRLTRAGDEWTLRYSTDGQNWTEVGSFTFAMTASQAGLSAGNYAADVAPAFLARFDYFSNTASPLTVEDGPPQGLQGFSIKTSTVGNGTISLSPQQALYYCGEVVTATAVPESGWEFAGWAGDLSGNANPIQLGMSASGTVVATFLQPGVTGLLQVNLTPAEAVAAGAQWSLDGGAFQNSGAVVSVPSGGSHVVSFKGATGFTTPANQTIDIPVSQTTTISANYEAAAAATGSLKVNIAPAEAVTAGAQWRLDNGALQNSGATLSGVSVGSHTVSFSNVSAWNTPVNQSVSIAASQTATVTGTYTAVTANTGSVKVTILPSDVVTAGAQWRLDGGELQTSGATLNNVSPGDHTVSFSAVDDWNAPADQTVTVSASHTATATGEYTQVEAVNPGPPPCGLFGFTEMCVGLLVPVLLMGRRRAL